MPTLTAGSETLVNTTTAGHQSRASIQILSDGSYVIAWQSHGQDGSGWGIYAQRYSADGTPLGAETRVNTFTSDNQNEPAISALTGGGYVITWLSYGQDGSAAGIYAQRYDATGAPQGGEVHVSTNFTAGEQFVPAVAGLADGGYVITWYSWDGSGYSVYAQRYDPSGVPQGSPFLVNDTVPGDQHNPSIAALPDGGFVIAWMSTGQDGDGYGIYTKRYDASGAAQGAETQVNSTIAGDQYYPVVAGLNDGNYVIVWWGPDGSGNGIYAQRYSAAGLPLGGETLVNTFVIGDQSNGNGQTVTALMDGGYLIAWSSAGQDGSGYGIFARRFDAAGNPVGPEFQVNETAFGDQMDPVVVGLSDGGFAAAWQDASGIGGDASGFGIKLRTYSVANFIDGTEGDDHISGTPDNDVINGFGGNDQLVGLGGDDTLYGGSGNDILRGDGPVSYNGPSGNDMLYGGAGDDLMYGGAGVDTYDGGDGFDRVSFFAWAATQGAIASLATQTVSNDGFGNVESLISVEALGDGTAFADHFTGDDSNNFMLGSSADVLIANGGDDRIQLTGAPALVDGGAGIDTITRFYGDVFGRLIPDSNSDGLAELAFATAGVHVNLGAGLIVDDGFGASGTLISIENVGGSGLDDILIGDDGINSLSGFEGNDGLDGGDGDDRLDGGEGDDQLTGGGGDDFLIGGLGRDILSGGAGRDTFAFHSLSDSAPSAPDLILDFDRSDTLDFSAIDGNANIAGQQGFKYVKKFTGAGGEIAVSYDATANVTHLLFDVNGDRVADMALDLLDNHSSLIGLGAAAEHRAGGMNMPWDMHVAFV